MNQPITLNYFLNRLTEANARDITYSIYLSPLNYNLREAEGLVGSELREIRTREADVAADWESDDDEHEIDW